MKIEKPMTDNEKFYGNKLYKFMMLANGFVTKEQMLKELGWDTSKDRQLRNLISLIAQKVPVISTSDSKGYKIAKTESDLEDARHSWAEMSSRIEELEKRIKPLIDFIEKFRR